MSTVDAVRAEPGAIRSMVFVPAHDPEVVHQAVSWGCDAVCLDLEDLTPSRARAEARNIFADVAAAVAGSGVRLMVRVDASDERAARRDLEAVVVPSLHCVNIPKVEIARQVTAVADLLAAIEHEVRLPDAEQVLLRPIVESARAVRNAFSIAAASPRVCYMGGVQGSWGGDLSASIGYVPSSSGVETLFVRSSVLVDVRAAGVRYPIGGGPIGSTDLEDVRGFFEECRQLGYVGVHCPRSERAVRLANEVFTPQPETVADLLELLDALEAAERDGLGSVWLDGRHYSLVCLPRVRDAVALARRAGLAPAFAASDSHRVGG